MSFPPEKICCDPLKRHKKCQRRDLRPVSHTIILQHPSIGLTCLNYLCSACRKSLKHQHQAAAATSIPPDMDDLQSDTGGDTTEVTVDSSDTVLDVPFSEQESTHSADNVFDENEQLFDDGFAGMSAQDAEEMIQQLKEKFDASVSRSEKLTILTILPQSWSLHKISRVFGVSRYLARKAKLLAAEKGVLSSPNPQHVNILSQQTSEMIRNFYLSDDISRVMPGQKDVVSVLGADEKRLHVQKQLLLCNLKEAYAEWKNRHPGIKVGFSRFASLRPRECIIAGAGGTHSVCVCTIHQNVKLMMMGSKLSSLSGGKLGHYSDCLSRLQCNPPSLRCIYGDCKKCPGVEPFCEELQAILDGNAVESVEVRQWTHTDRATLETKVMSTDEFVDAFIPLLLKLSIHDFTAKMQAAFVNETKGQLKDGEYLVIADFSENYSFVVQDAVQAFHWNNGSATIHPFVCYYRENGELCHLCYIIISESTQHDTVAVHLFQKKLIAFLTKRRQGRRPQKIFYVSDGCAAQYKNCKNFLNLCSHEADFGVPAEWHFFCHLPWQKCWRWCWGDS